MSYTSHLEQTPQLLYKVIACCVCAILLTNHSICVAKSQAEQDPNLQRFANKDQRCGRDHFEPNDYRSRARNITTELKNHREVSAKLCGHDQDWFTVWLNRGELVEFEVYSALEEPPLMQVYAPRKRKASGIMKQPTPSSRLLKLYVKQSGRYRLKISPKRKAQSRYTLSLHRPAHP